MLCFLFYRNAVMLHWLSRNQWWMGQANCGSQISDKQKGKQDFLLMSCLSFSPYNGDKGGMKIYSFSASGTCI